VAGKGPFVGCGFQKRGKKRQKKKRISSGVARGKCIEWQGSCLTRKVGSERKLAGNQKRITRKKSVGFAQRQP